MLVTLTDSTRVRMRFIAASDKPLLGSAIARLSPRSQVQRFFVPKERFSDAELRYLTEVDGHDHVAIVAVLESDPSVLVGVGRYIRDPDAPDQAEIAIVVADALQGRGLGRTLGLALADVAKAHGVRRFTASMLGTNVAAHRVFESISRRASTEYSAGIGHLVAELETREQAIAESSLAA